MIKFCKEVVRGIFLYFKDFKSKEEEEEYNALSDNDKIVYHYIPLIILLLLPVGAFLYLFGEGFQSGKVMFSNDGPLGVMKSAWVRDGYKPGAPMWNDSWWLGANHGTTPISFTTVIFWLFNNPAIFLTVIFCIIWILAFYFRHFKPSYEKLIPEPEPEPKDRTIGIGCCRALFAFVCLLLYIGNNIGLDAIGWEIYFQKALALFLLFYSLVGIPLWISTEVEHSEFLEKNN